MKHGAIFVPAALVAAWLGGKDPAVVRGRPAGLAVAKDGSLLIADDYASVIWRVRYAP